MVMWVKLLIHDIKQMLDQDIFISDYSDVIMGTMASEITSLAVVYSTVYSGADLRYWPLCGKFTGDR